MACSALAQSPPDQRQQIETHLQKAREFLKNSRTDLAAGEFKAVVALDPKTPMHEITSVCCSSSAAIVRRLFHIFVPLSTSADSRQYQALLGMCEKRTGEIGSRRGRSQESLPGYRRKN